MGAQKEHKVGMNRRGVVRGAIVLVAVGTLLAGCGGGTGFRPLHATSGFGGTNVSEKLAEVQVAPIPGRVGQRIRNELIFQTTEGSKAIPSKYRLEIAVRQTVAATIVQRDGEASGQVYNLDASFRLINIEAQEVVLTGKSYGRAGFERFESIFANVRARRDAENRAAQTVAGELKSRLEAYLASAA